MTSKAQKTKEKIDKLDWMKVFFFNFAHQKTILTKYIMRNSGLEETQAGIKIAGRNINNLRYADDTTLMA